MNKPPSETIAKKKTGIETTDLIGVAAPIEKREANRPSTKANLDVAAMKKEESARPPGKAAKTAKANGSYDELFDRWDSEGFVPTESMLEVAVDCLESVVGYSSLFRQMQQSFLRMVAFHKSDSGGRLSDEDARAKAFHACTNEEEAKKKFDTLLRVPLESLHFVDLLELHVIAPRVAERLWERIKHEGQKEFLSGHLSANISFPVGYMKEVWNIARYQGVRATFIAEWVSKGGIETSLLDIMTQSYFQWQFWLEETVKRSQTREREQHPEYTEWMNKRERELRRRGWTDGSWFRPLVSEQQAIEHAVQMADRWNRIYMRTLRQLRDLRRYAQVTINNPSQVNIAGDGGKQINVGPK
jgi:hypothetical protein